MAVEFFQEGANLNFPECREFVMSLAPKDMRICTRVDEKESKEAEIQFFDPLVSELARDDKLVEANKMMLLQYAARKSAEEDPIDWDALERERRVSRGVVVGQLGMTTRPVPLATSLAHYLFHMNCLTLCMFYV